MRALLSRLLSMARRRPLDRDLDEEITAHLALQEAEFQAFGMTPEAARASALRQFGEDPQAKEEYRERRGVPWLETIWRDIRYALRGLARNPGFTAAAILSLGLGIGANTAIFGLFHSLMLRMRPVSQPQQLVNMFRTGVSKSRFTRRPGDRGEFAQQEFVSGNYFSVLGVGAAVGRVFTPQDNTTPALLRDSLVLVTLGLAIGLPAAFLSARAVQAMLFDIPPGDPPALLLTALTLSTAGIAAAYLPARRAASVDPTQVLRSE